MNTFFEPELPSDGPGLARTMVTDGLKPPGERRSPLKLQANKSGSKAPPTKAQRPLPNPEKRNNNHATGRWSSPDKTSWNVLDLKGENYFSCAVGRTRTNARYLLGSSDDVVSFLKDLAEASAPRPFVSD